MRSHGSDSPSTDDTADAVDPDIGATDNSVSCSSTAADGLLGCRRTGRGHRPRIGEIVLRWTDGMRPLDPVDVPPDIPRSPVDVWHCPVCEERIARRPGAGRQRVYCTNACRQFAYRWRRNRLGVATDRRPLVRASTRELHHAARRSDDPVSALVHSSGKRVTVCGAFARTATDRPRLHGHVRLLPVRSVAEGSPARVCARCVELTGVPTYDDAAALRLAGRLRAEHDDVRREAVARRRRSGFGRRRAPVYGPAHGSSRSSDDDRGLVLHRRHERR